MNILFDIIAKPVIAHSGGRARGPENTLEAMRLGVAAGADAIELDVHRCASGEIVVIHDATVDRTTDGSGAVAAMTLAELRSLDAGARFRVAKMSCRIPTLAEVLETFREVPLIIEVKTPAASAATRALIEKYGAESRCLVDSFHASALEIFSGSRIARGPSRDGVARLIASCFLPPPLRPRVAVDAICIPRHYRGFPLPVRRLAALLRSSGKPTHVWTVNDAAEARELWGQGVCGINTDDVAAMIGARRTN